MTHHELRNWDDVRFFLEVFDRGSFTAAAKALASDQSTVGRRIAALETRLGAKLFERHGRGIVPTSAAKGLADHARTMSDSAQVIERRFAGIDRGLSGLVRIGATQVLAATWLTPRIQTFQRTHPDIEIQVVAGNRVADLASRETDLVITRTPLDNPRLVGSLVGVMRFVVCASVDYASRYGLPKSLEDILGHPIVAHLALDGPAMAPWNAVMEGHKRVPFRTDNSYCHYNALLAGIGVGLVPTYALNTLPGLVRAPVEFAACFDLWLMSHEETHHVARNRAAIDFLKEQFQRDRSDWFS